MSITVTTDTVGLDALIARMTALQAVVAEYAEKIAETARSLSPTDTGALRDSITVTLNGLAATITAGEGLPDARAVAEEFGYMHHGSGAFIAHPYMTPAVEQHLPEFIRAVQRIIGG